MLNGYAWHHHVALPHHGMRMHLKCIYGGFILFHSCLEIFFLFSIESKIEKVNVAPEDKVDILGCNNREKYDS